MSLGNLAAPSEGMSVLRDHSLSPGFLSQSLVTPSPVHTCHSEDTITMSQQPDPNP